MEVSPPRVASPLNLPPRPILPGTSLHCFSLVFFLLLLLFVLSVIIESSLVAPTPSVSATARLRSSLNGTKLLTNEQTVDALLDLMEICKSVCPVELLEQGLLKKHSSYLCLGRSCGVCSNVDHYRKDCSHRIQIKDVCFFCYLPKSLGYKQLHDPDSEFGKNACPWKNVTLTVMKMALAGDREVLEAVGNLGTNSPTSKETREQMILLKLWKTPTTGQLLPLGVSLLVRLARRIRE